MSKLRNLTDDEQSALCKRIGSAFDVEHFPEDVRHASTISLIINELLVHALVQYASLKDLDITALPEEQFDALCRQYLRQMLSLADGLFPLYVTPRFDKPRPQSPEVP